MIDFSKSIWEVEVVKDQNCIVARSKNGLSKSQLLVEGYKYAQMFLDILSAYKNDSLFIRKPSECNIMFYEKDNAFIFRDTSIHEFKIRISIEAFVQNSKGELVKPVEEDFNWFQSLRFYRLSQLSSDLYDAYRNLFLAFESLLSIIGPKNREEGEIQWLRRVLAQIESQINIQCCVPEGSNLSAIDYFIMKQYKDIRCKLFHSKNMNVLPHDSVNPIVIESAFSNLLIWWKKISKSCKNIPDNNGGITMDAFKMMMDNIFRLGFQFEISDDDSPLDPDVKTASSLNKKVFKFSENKYECFQNTFEIKLKGSLDLKEGNILPTLYRISTSTGGKLITTQFYEEGLWIGYT
jgi:hypothetical protein